MFQGLYNFHIEIILKVNKVDRKCENIIWKYDHTYLLNASTMKSKIISLITTNRCQKNSQDYDKKAIINKGTIKIPIKTLNSSLQKVFGSDIWRIRIDYTISHNNVPRVI